MPGSPRGYPVVLVVLALLIVGLAVGVSGLAASGATVGGVEGVPSWLEVTVSGDIVVVKVRPTYYLGDGTPVVVVSDPGEVEVLAREGSGYIVGYAIGLLGGESRAAEASYEGPGSIVAARVAPGGGLLLLVAGDVDLGLVRVEGSGIGEYSRVVVVESDFEGNLCSPEVDEGLSQAISSTFLGDVLVEVSCFPPIVSVDKTRLEELGYSPVDVVSVLKEAGVEGFYLFLVEDYRAAVDRQGPTFLAPENGGDADATAAEAGSGWGMGYVAASGIVGLLVVGVFLARRLMGTPV